MGDRHDGHAPGRRDPAGTRREGAAGARNDRARLDEAGASLADVVSARCFVIDLADRDLMVPVVREHFGAVRPAMTMVRVAGLIDPRHRIEIEVEAVIGSA